MLLCLPDCDARTVILTHVHATELCHLAAAATLHRVAGRFYVPRASKVVHALCRRCPECIASKSLNFTYGPLQPLPAPSAPFAAMSLDFFEWTQPQSKANFCLAVTDRFSEFIFLIPTEKTCSASDAARLFLEKVMPYTGWPRTSCQTEIHALRRKYGQISLP